jgi:hypothetical protein
MLIQIFRNRISQSYELRQKTKTLESAIAANVNQKESDIVREFTKEWNKKPHINLKPFLLNGNPYYLWVKFVQWPTHGYSISVNDIMEVDSEKIECSTEYGDVAIVVDYLFENYLIARKVSIIQTKKEKRQNEVEITLHQLYLMQNWPCVNFPNGTKYRFNGVHADEFSFYHTILNCSQNSRFSSSIISAPLVGHLLGADKHYIESKLKTWLHERKTNHNKPPPSDTLRFNLIPGAIFKTNSYQSWNLVPRPLVRFLYDAAYLFVGTDHQEILDLTQARVQTILSMKVMGSRERGQVDKEKPRSDNDFVWT